MLSGDTERTQVGKPTEADMTYPPISSFLLAFSAMVPVALGAVSARALPAFDDAIERLTTQWAGAVLCFLAGVRRGLSFRQPGGATIGELATMLTSFVAGAASLLLPRRRAAQHVLLAGFAGLAASDARAARRAEAPYYFARLRPVQMLIPIVALGLLAANRRKDGDCG